MIMTSNMLCKVRVKVVVCNQVVINQLVTYTLHNIIYDKLLITMRTCAIF